MKDAKLPFLFVIGVVCALLIGAAGLVFAVSHSASDEAASSRPVDERHADQRPTGSSIEGAPPATAWQESTPSTVSSSTSTSTSTTTTSTTTRPTTIPSVTRGGTPMTVTYEVSGPGPATMLTYWQGDHDIASEQDAILPWSRTVVLIEQSTIRLSAQIIGGIVHCRISVDGQVVAEETQTYFVSCQTTLRPAVHDG